MGCSHPFKTNIRRLNAEVLFLFFVILSSFCQLNSIIICKQNLKKKTDKLGEPKEANKAYKKDHL